MPPSLEGASYFLDSPEPHIVRSSLPNSASASSFAKSLALTVLVPLPPATTSCTVRCLHPHLNSPRIRATVPQPAPQPAVCLSQLPLLGGGTSILPGLACKDFHTWAPPTLAALSPSRPLALYSDQTGLLAWPQLCPAFALSELRKLPLHAPASFLIFHEVLTPTFPPDLQLDFLPSKVCDRFSTCHNPCGKICGLCVLPLGVKTLPEKRQMSSQRAPLIASTTGTDAS